MNKEIFGKHSVKITITEEFQTNFEFVCNEPEDALCHLECKQGCESWEAEGHIHSLEPIGHCGFITWLEAEGGAECFAGNYEIEKPARIWWDGDGVLWS